METAAESKDPQIVENLLSYFVQIGSKEWFTSCLYICYEWIKPDIVLELAWRHDMMDFAMPFMIQFLRESSTRIEELEKINIARSKREEERERQGLDAPMFAAPPLGQTMMITAGPSSMSAPSSTPLPVSGIPRNYLPSSAQTSYPSSNF